MRHFNKELEIEKVFLENGFTNKEFVVGTGDTFYKKGKKVRFEFDARSRDAVVNHTAKWAVKYFSEQNFCILWKVYAKTTQSRYCYRYIYSIDVDEAMETYNTNRNAKKGVEFEWRFEEDVIVTNFDDFRKIVANLSK